MAAVITVDGVSKTFPGAERPAVEDVRLSVEAEEMLVILGSSGSGKTTLLKMINRIHEADAGAVYVDGRDVRETPVSELRRGIGYVIQQVGLFPHQTVAQNIGTVPRIMGWDRRRIEERVDFLLRLMRLPPEEYRARLPRQLSGGEQQRVGIARALAADPPVLLMDEPFGALDAITRTGLQEELLRIQAQYPKTILFVTHDVDEALKLADRIVVMEAGRIEQQGPPLELLTRPATPFVAELLDADNLLQHLRVVAAADVMERVEGGTAAPDGAPDADAGSRTAASDGAPVTDAGIRTAAPDGAPVTDAGSRTAASDGAPVTDAGIRTAAPDGAPGTGPPAGGRMGTAAGVPTVAPDTSLRDGLTALLQADRRPVPVVDGTGRAVGFLKWEHVLQVVAGRNEAGGGEVRAG